MQGRQLTSNWSPSHVNRVGINENVKADDLTKHSTENGSVNVTTPVSINEIKRIIQDGTRVNMYEPPGHGGRPQPGGVVHGA